jgi:hypothetical protein
MEPIGTLSEPIVTCRDGYIRVSLKRLSMLHFVHVTSACDKILLAELIANAIRRVSPGTQMDERNVSFRIARLGLVSR